MTSSSTRSLLPWWHPDIKDAGERARLTISNFRAIDQDQLWVSERNIEHLWLYEPTSSLAMASDTRLEIPRARPQGENAVEPIVETGVTLVTKNRTRAVPQTDNASWELMEQADLLLRYLDGEFHRLRAWPAITQLGRHGAVYGLGEIEVFEGGDGRPALANILAHDLIVPEDECRPGCGGPRQKAKRIPVNKWQLIARYPKFKNQILDAAMRTEREPWWTDYRRVPADSVMVLHAWHLPSLPGHGDGREVVAIDHCPGPLFDAPYTRDHFPFVEFRWRPRQNGEYGVGLVESLLPMQERLNRHIWFQNRAEDLYAIPRVFFMSPADANITGKMDNAIGRVFVVPSGQQPFFSTPPPANPQIYNRSGELFQHMFLIAGVSQGSVGGTKPGGLESGEAIIQWRDLSTERHALPELAIEQATLDLAQLLIEQAKISARRNRGAVKTAWWDRDIRQEINWDQINIPDDAYTLRLEPASITQMTPAGQRQRIRNDVRDGLLSPDQIRSLNLNPDISSMESFLNSPEQMMRKMILKLFRGEKVVVDPIMAMWPGALEMARNAYLMTMTKEGCPERVQESCRRFMEGIEHYQKKAAQEQQAQLAMMQPPPMPGMNGAAPPPMTPAIPASQLPTGVPPGTMA